MGAGGHIQHFNLDTMSGVSPGARTQTFQRIRLRALNDQAAGMLWAQLQWYAEPTSCALYLQTADGQWAGTPLLQLDAPLDDFNHRLQEGLLAAGWALECCAGCAFW